MGTRLSGETIGRRRQVFGIPFAVILDLVDEFLRVLYAHAEGEGLGFQQPAVGVEHGIDVACRMSRG